MGVLTFGEPRFGLDEVLSSKGLRRVSVCIPARNEERTIGSVLERSVLPHLGPSGSGLVDEVIVIDDGSSDNTAAIARAAGARVITRRPGGDKGAAMAAGFEESTGDIVVFLDGDVENADERFVPRLVGPILSEEAVLVKAFYERPINGRPSGGGRVTELLARPLLSLLFPAVADVRQPLAGETAAQRWVFEKIGFAAGYGVEIGMLIDAAREFGAHSIAQVDLGVRVHRNRPLSELRPQAEDVLRTALERAGLAG